MRKDQLMGWVGKGWLMGWVEKGLLMGWVGKNWLIGCGKGQLMGGIISPILPHTGAVSSHCSD